MATDSAAKKSQENLADQAVEKYVKKDKRKTQQVEATEENVLTAKFANIESNPFHQLVIHKASGLGDGRIIQETVLLEIGLITDEAVVGLPEFHFFSGPVT